MANTTLPSVWIRFWHKPVRGERLAIARIAVAATLLADQLFQYLPNLALFFGPNGYAPAGVNDAYLLRAWRWTILFFNTDDMTIIWMAFALWVAVTLMFLLGWRTRTMGVMVWFGALCFLNRNPNLKNGGDDVLQLALFLLMISPCGTALSLDRVRMRKRCPEALPTPPMIAPWAVRLFQMQLCVLYLATGVAKLRGHMWWHGTTLHYVLNDVTMTRWSFAQLPLPIWITAALSYASVWWEALFTPLVLWKPTRRWALLFGVLFHLGIYLMIEVGWFSFYTLTMYVVWIPDEWWEKKGIGGRRRN